VKKEVRRDPHFYQHYDYPLHGPEDLDRMILPDAGAAQRYQGFAAEVAYYKQHDLITYANLNGFFSGIHYYLYPYDLLLMDLLLEPDFVQAMLDRLGAWNLCAAEHLLQCGVDVIAFCDDLGSGQSLLMSPLLYRRFFAPWHKRLADLCHRYGALLHMHSHGNINAIIGDLCAAGIDLLNPNDPEEGMDLPALKRTYGDHITFAGGLDKTFFTLPQAGQEARVRGLVQETGGGFILMDAGGVPEGVTPVQFARIMALFNEVKS
jgi:uroporphyrinogen decarboxylase